MNVDVIIEEKPAFTLIGTGRDFTKDSSLAQIQEYWDEFVASDNQPIKGRFGICIDKEDSIRYLIADIYYPWISVLPGMEPLTT